MEGDQLCNKDWPWNPFKSVQRKVSLFIKVIPCIPKAKNGKYSYQEQKKETYDGAHRLNRFSQLDL
jgi:hypothetical protein